MGFPRDNITTWAQMEETFNKKYKDYYRSKETKDGIFRMTLGPDESIEEYEGRFQLKYKRANYTLDPTSLPSHPSLFFSDNEIEPPIGEPSDYFEDAIGE